MGKLIIKRHKDFFNFLYPFKIIINGVESDEISSGQTIYCNIDDHKSHTIFVKQKSFRSPIVNIDGDKDIILEAGTTENPKRFAILFIVSGLLQLLTIKSEYHFYAQLINSFVIVFFLLHLFIFRKKYLTLKKI